jgi:hypothetical protein
MLPGLSIGAFLLATASVAGGGGSPNPVTLENETISKTTTDGSAATASFTIRTDRTVQNHAGTTIDSAWLASGYSASDYSVRVTVNSGTTPTGTIGSWLALTSNRTWSLTDAAGASGTKTCSLKVEIKENASGTILDTATYTLTADSQASGGGGSYYDPAAGSYYDTGIINATLNITASSSVPWTWSATSLTGLTANIASGGSGTMIQFTLTAGATERYTEITVNSGGNTWNLTLETPASSTD